MSEDNPIFNAGPINATSQNEQKLRGVGNEFPTVTGTFIDADDATPNRGTAYYQTGTIEEGLEIRDKFAAQVSQIDKQFQTYYNPGLYPTFLLQYLKPWQNNITLSQLKSGE